MEYVEFEDIALELATGGTGVQHGVFSPPSWRVEGGGVIAVLGDNGAGKTSFLRALSGEGGGHIALHGRLRVNTEWLEMKDVAASISPLYLSSGESLFDDLTVRESLTVATLCSPRVSTFSDGGHDDAAELAGCYSMKVRELSGGYRQRLAIAMAERLGSRVVMLDEPSNWLDRDARTTLVGAVGRMSRSGRLVLVTEHDKDVLHELKGVLADAKKQYIEVLLTLG